ncbi:hypothetical protein G7085_14720 [Tessaracoccus sp. HDW20]|uniref:zinc-dependent metalloprotease n=1 Tax=Tessaracoccus coleopterorum TaxID=2714950 RepID=UPI0018D356BF|nr:zinc-dependent metalloprotease [Tessaracoccus coleopterorum]NHB85447.1 hypothetical protein [Tessaracoccus coleopterorum]
MEHAANIDWDLALRVASAGNRDLPDLTAPNCSASWPTCASPHAGPAGWWPPTWGSTRRVRRGSASSTGPVGACRARHGRARLHGAGACPRRPGPVASVRGVGNALLLGVGLKVAGRRLLGQYDAYTGADTLYLVAPTIVAHERAHRFDPADFRLWVSLHEQTHSLQFRAAPWLRGWIAGRARTVFEDDSSSLQGLAGWARTGDIASLLATGPAGEALGELVSAMTFLEGHADHTADAVGRTHIPTVAKLRSAFTRRSGRGLSRVLDKQAQYRDGLEFCRKVTMYRDAGPSAPPSRPREIYRPPMRSRPRAPGSTGYMARRELAPTRCWWRRPSPPGCPKAT